MKNRSFWIDNLRSFVILLVVGHHAALAYPTFARFDKAAYIFSSHPMVDPQRWIGMDRFIYFNDIFLMALMFFISGLFVMNSLRKKGPRTFLRDRFNRLFIPFAVGVTILMPIAHYPSFLVAHEDYSIKNYLIDYFTTEYWPVGPPWFIWVLFLFNMVFVWIYRSIKSGLDRLGQTFIFFEDKPFLLFLAWFAFTWILYVPMRLIFGPYQWTGIGPFDFQISTFFMYFGYFLAGIVFGSIPSDKGLFPDTFNLMRKWPLWIILCLFLYALLVSIDNPSLGNPLQKLVESNTIGDATAQIIYCSLYVATCITGCIAYLTFFRAMADFTNKFWNSLASNSFFIYLIHYVFVIWSQYLLLQSTMPAILKFSIVFIISFSASWLLGRLVHKNHKLSIWF